MTHSNDHRLRAEESLQKASLAQSDADKRTQLTMFNGWRPAKQPSAGHGTKVSKIAIKA